MSLMAHEQVREALVPLRRQARARGTTLAAPFLQVAFLPLPVIPPLKITEKGLVDVDRCVLIDGPRIGHRPPGTRRRDAFAGLEVSVTAGRWGEAPDGDK